MSLSKEALNEYHAHVIGDEKCEACCCSTSKCGCGGLIHGIVVELSYEGDAIHDTECDQCHKGSKMEEEEEDFDFVTPARKMELREELKHSFDPESMMIPGRTNTYQKPDGSVVTERSVVRIDSLHGPSCKICGGPSNSRLHNP